MCDKPEIFLQRRQHGGRFECDAEEMVADCMNASFRIDAQRQHVGRISCGRYARRILWLCRQTGAEQEQGSS